MMKPVPNTQECAALLESIIADVLNENHPSVQGLNPDEYTVLHSISEIGKVYSAGILAEIGSVKAFQITDSLAKYCGILWNDNDSCDLEAENKRMSKAGNRYFRYYIIEATGRVIRYCPEYEHFYQKKYAETRTHQHKRALALTSRKFIRLSYERMETVFNALNVPQSLDKAFVNRT